MKRLKVAIADSGYKQGWVAKQAGVDYTLMSKYVNGERETPAEVLRAVAKILRVPIGNVSGEVE